MLIYLQENEKFRLNNVTPSQGNMDGRPFMDKVD